MKIVQARYSERGPVPHELIRAEEVDCPSPGAGQVLVEVLAAPINPSDLLTLTGDYGVLPDLPAVGGNEGVGRVVETGSGVSQPSVGQTVLLPVGSGTWASHLVTDAAGLVSLPVEADPLQLAMLTINPPTAALLLEEFVDLEPGDWVIQNAANSAVGGYLVQLAAEKGLRTINVVRRADAVAAVRDQGGDVVVVDGEDLGRRVREATEGASIRLGIDAVAGEATERISGCLAPGATLVNYGVMSGEPCRISPGELIFRSITLTGFWLATWFERSDEKARAELFGGLTAKVAGGQLRAPVAATYGLDRIRDAVKAAESGARGGKILIVPGETDSS